MEQSPSWEANWFAASPEIPRISRNPKVHYRIHKRPPPVSILGQPNPAHIPTSHLLEIHPNIIHPSTPRSPQWSLSLQFPHQDPIHPLSSPYAPHAQPISLQATIIIFIIGFLLNAASIQTTNESLRPLLYCDPVTLCVMRHTFYGNAMCLSFTIRFVSIGLLLKIPSTYLPYIENYWSGSKAYWMPIVAVQHTLPKSYILFCTEINFDKTR